LTILNARFAARPFNQHIALRWSLSELLHASEEAGHDGERVGRCVLPIGLLH
jgi:hypothetical protein